MQSLKVSVLVSLLSISLVGCAILNFGVSQDCGDYASAIQGMVRNSITREPVAGAEVVVRSRGVSDCPNSRPIDEVRMITDEQGRFYHEVFIYADDNLELTVTAPGCETYTQENVNFTMFIGTIGDVQGMRIDLFCGNPALMSTVSP